MQLVPRGSSASLPASAASHRHGRPITVLVAFAAGYYVSYLFRTVNAVIAPELSRELGAGPAELGFLTSTYFLSFALAQIPVGVALDRFGPRRVVSALLVVAAAGAALFAAGTDLAELALGRGLIGLGVSACLMGGLKALGAAFAPERQASVTGFIMAAGALGALSTSLPVEWMLPIWGWRGALGVVAGVSALAALLIAVAVPRGLARGGLAPAGLGPELAVLRTIARSPAFWRYAPQAALFTGGFMALQGLWAGPFLRVVEGRDRAGVAFGLLALNLGLLVGQLGIGIYATALARRGFRRAPLMTASLAVALLLEAVIILRGSSGFGGHLLWFAFGCANAASAQVYGVTASAFPATVSARVSTAINQCAFLGAFALQWGIGAAIEALTARLGGPSAFRAALGGMWIAQALAVAHSARRTRPGARPDAPTSSS